MKIFYITQVGIPSTAAQSVGAMCLCDAYANLGHETILITKNKFWERPPKGYNGDIYDFYGVSHKVKVVKLLVPPRQTSWFQRRALNCLKGGNSFISTRSIKLAAIAVTSKHHVLLDRHTVITDEDAENLKQWIDSVHFIGMVVITESLRQHYIEKIPALSNKIVVAPNGVRYPAYAAARSKEVVTNSGFVAGYLGSFYQGKGAEIVIELAKLCPDVSFNIYGGSEGKLKSSFNIGQLPGNLTVGGFVPQADVPQIMASFDIALLPNQEKVIVANGKEDMGNWTSPIKLFEYMASGCAIIASDLPVIREILVDQSNALLVPPANYDAWRDAIKLLQSEPAIRKRLGKQAQKEAKEKYSWQAKAERIIKGLEIEAKILK